MNKNQLVFYTMTLVNTHKYLMQIVNSVTQWVQHKDHFLCNPTEKKMKLFFKKECTLVKIAVFF